MFDEEIKREAKTHFESMWRKRGNLTEDEIREYSNFEYELGPITITDQLRRYYLKIKEDDPVWAEQLHFELPTFKEEELTEGTIITLCHVLYKYISGFVLVFHNQCYSTSSRPIFEDTHVKYV